MRILKLHPRLAVSAAVAALVLLLLPGRFALAQRLVMAWDVGAGLYLALAAQIMAKAGHAGLRRRAAEQDDGRAFVLAVTVAAAIASLGAIVALLVGLRDLPASARDAHLVLAGVTVAVSWLFVHAAFALHYAHEYFAGDAAEGAARGGLSFSGGEMPDYWDFVYFSFAIGTAAATSDTNVTNRGMRRLVALHSVVAFLFNTAILGLTVNIAAGLLN
jgi:uncharacterized membrane protein